MHLNVLIYLFQRPGSGSQVDLATENFTETKNNSIVDVKTLKY
jgi:hypothetical protein